MKGDCVFRALPSSALVLFSELLTTLTTKKSSKKVYF